MNGPASAYRLHRVTVSAAELSEKALTRYRNPNGLAKPTGVVAEAHPEGRGFVAGPVPRIYVHGLFEQPNLVLGLIGAPPARSLDQAFDGLADAVEANPDINALRTKIGAT